MMSDLFITFFLFYNVCLTSFILLSVPLLTRSFSFCTSSIADLFKCLLYLMDNSQGQEHDFGVLLKQGAEGVST
jgi:hypothetical protein